jgi:thiamine biosynthesis lipoprotein
MSDVSFRTMGSDARLIVEGGPAGALEDARALIDEYAARLTRFDPSSDLCRLNAAPEAEVRAGDLLRRTVHAGLWAARRTGGLVDPTLVRELEDAGYAESRDGAGVSLRQALAAAPARRPGAPDPAARWRAVEVDDERRTIRRPPGLALDSGGVGKGLAADLVARRLAGADRVAVDLGGDVRVGGRATASRPFDLQVLHPLTGECASELRISGGAVATSGLDVRVWLDEDGRPAHHLLDPSTGRPAWTGLIGATALAPSALEAETLAKAALLSGPAHAGRWLRAHGGLVVREDGEVVPFGVLRPRLVVRLPKVPA